MNKKPTLVIMAAGMGSRLEKQQEDGIYQERFLAEQNILDDMTYDQQAERYQKLMSQRLYFYESMRLLNSGRDTV